MTISKLINYTTREFISDNELELYVSKQDEIFTPEVIKEFSKAGMLRRVLTRIWNKEGVARVGILFEYRENQEEVFLGRSVTQTQSVSEEVAQKIDKEIRKLVDEGYNKAKEILTEKIDDLHKIAKALITYETLTGEEIENIINKNLYPKDKILDNPESKDDQDSALGAMGLKPKIVH